MRTRTPHQQLHPLAVLLMLCLASSVLPVWWLFGPLAVGVLWLRWITRPNRRRHR
jgi:hypothetical protein